MRSEAKTTEAFLDLVNEVGINFIKDFSEANIGNPNVVRLGGGSYNYNDLYMIQFANKIINHVKFSPKIICDIGGGYGSLGVKLKRHWKNSTVVFLDLPEINIVQIYYITQLYPDAKILTLNGLQEMYPGTWNEEKISYDFLQQYDFVILPGWIFEKFEDKIVDLIINTRSMMEMHSSIVNDYIYSIQKKLKVAGVFYCANRYIKSSVGYPIKLTDYPFDSYWEVLRSSVSWRQPQIHELILERSNLLSDVSVKEKLVSFLIDSTLTINSLDVNRSFIHDMGKSFNIKSKTKYLIRITFRRIYRNFLNEIPVYLRYIFRKKW